MSATNLRTVDVRPIVAPIVLQLLLCECPD
jgi:hypothetical protein